MSTLTTPDELHASRASSSEHSLTATHIDHDTASQSNFGKGLSDVEKSALSVFGSSSTSLKTDPLYVRHPDLVGGICPLTYTFRLSSRTTIHATPSPTLASRSGVLRSLFAGSPVLQVLAHRLCLASAVNFILQPLLHRPLQWGLNPWCAICTVLRSRPRSHFASIRWDLHSSRSSRLRLAKRLGEGQFISSPPLLRCCVMYSPQCSF
jgi:hypothetical protein